MTEPFNDYGMVEILDKRDVSDRFKRVRFMDFHLAQLNGFEDGYLVFADTMRYRMDSEPHPLDVSDDNARGRQAHEADVEAYLRSLE
ncbi:hypothetical protein I7F96_32235 [Sinorhizobium meliloti]|uniref:hypothetical protein n=1 Tax=Rhizobium meliloti TaxID=382 RepID=UPI002380732E|nr:hypothetical protein [Sinorhizobium meliloti]MDE3775433.1 hypothetical protein [Sinorhizobium meliloti]